MSAKFHLISWTPYKKRYDLIMGGLVAAYLLGFLAVGKLVWREDRAISDEILVLRALGTCAFLMLNIALCIGPLTRLDRRFLPLLYNRRHLGVATLFVGLLHGVLSIGFYHGFGRLNPLMSFAKSNSEYRSLSAFPFEMLGGAALLILLVMAVTSHDVWLNKLTPRIWKGIHMLVYLAWGLLVMHIALGALQAERNLLYGTLLLLVVIVVSGLHVMAGRKEMTKDRIETLLSSDAGWINACSVAQLSEGRGRPVKLPSGERVALFKYDGQIFAISNVCAHQGGPLGEGRIVDGCVTCPWHGFQYRPGDGCAPPPFTEKLKTYEVRIKNGQVMVNIQARAPGTAIEPARIEEEGEAAHVG